MGIRITKRKWITGREDLEDYGDLGQLTWRDIICGEVLQDSCRSEANRLRV